MNDVVPLPGSPARGAPSVRLKRSLSALKPLLSFGAFLAGATSLAQSMPLPEIELERLTLNPAGTGSLVLGTGEVLRKGGYRLSLTGHYEHDPLVSVVNGKVDESVVEHRTTGYLAGAYGITDRLEISAQVPLLLMQKGDGPSWLAAQPARGLALGTPYLGVRLGLLRQHGSHGVDLALGLNAGLPLGSAASLAQDDTLRAIPSVMVGRTFGSVRAGVDAGLLVRPKAAVGNGEVNDALRLGAVVSTGKKLRGELNVIGHIPLHSNEPKSLEALAGARLNVSSSLEAYAVAGMGFGRTPGTPDFRGLMGVAYAFGGKQTIERKQQCPGDPGCEPVITTPPPPPPIPQPVVYFDFSQAQWDNPLAEFIKKNPNLKAREVKEFVNKLERIENPEQQRDELAKFNSKNSLNLTASQFHEIIERLNRIRSTKEQLNKLAAFLNAYPAYTTIWLEGHTDETPADKMGGNQGLSVARAQAVKEYLTRQRGVEEGRLLISGYADQNPIDPKNPAKNRRVEFCTTPRGENGERREPCVKVTDAQGAVANSTANGKQQDRRNDLPTTPREENGARQRTDTNGHAAQGPAANNSTGNGKRKNRQGQFHPRPRGRQQR